MSKIWISIKKMWPVGSHFTLGNIHLKIGGNTGGLQCDGCI